MGVMSTGGVENSLLSTALDTELFILLIKLQLLQQVLKETALRILTGPQWACPQTAKAKEAETVSG